MTPAQVSTPAGLTYNAACLVDTALHRSTKSTRSGHRSDEARNAIPEDVSAHILQKAKLYVAHRMQHQRERPLWSCSFATSGLGADVFIELQPDLVLAVRRRPSGEVLAQTRPVEFGPHDPCCIPLRERLLSWRDSRQQEGGDA